MGYLIQRGTDNVYLSLTSDSYLWLACKSLRTPCLQFSIADFTFNNNLEYSISSCRMRKFSRHLFFIYCTKSPSWMTSLRIHELMNNIILAYNHFASVDVYTCQTLPDRLTVDVSHEIRCLCVWTGWRLFPPRVDRHTGGWQVFTHGLSRSPWDVTLGYPTTMNEFTLFMDVMPNPFIQDMFLWLTDWAEISNLHCHEVGAVCSTGR